MNPVLILTHNCLEQTKRCVESVQNQDIPTFIFILDNGSTDGTPNWISANKLAGVGFEINKGVSYGWNKVLSVMFDGLNGNKDIFNGTTADHVLVLNNDTILGPTAYKDLLSYNVPFVSGRETTNLDDLKKPFEYGPVGNGPQFSCFLIRKFIWEVIGRFDESLKSWCGDLDYHYRAHRMGIELHSAPVPYYHERSTTIRTASSRERREMDLQADTDRDRLFQKWGAHAGPEFHALFTPETFGCDIKQN